MSEVMIAGATHISVSEVPVVLLHLNVGKFPEFFPNWVEDVERRPTSEQSVPKGGGVKVAQGRHVEMRFILDDLNERGFQLLRVHRLEQSNGHLRMIIVLVRQDLIKKDEPALSRVKQGEIRKLIKRHFWDTTVYRNYRDDGGNFVIDSGNPKQAERRSSRADLQLDEEGWFDIVTEEGEE